MLYLPHREHHTNTTAPTVVFDPNNPSQVNYVTSPKNYFCGGHTVLDDGRMLAMGGEDLTGEGLIAAGTFDYVTETWTEVANMRRKRWYPSAIQAGDGKIWTFGGQAIAADPSSNDDTVEVYDPKLDVWTLAGGQDMPGQYEEAYNRLHQLPDGKMFQTSHLPDTYIYDPSARSWSFVAPARWVPGTVSPGFGWGILSPLRQGRDAEEAGRAVFRRDKAPHHVVEVVEKDPSISLFRCPSTGGAAVVSSSPSWRSAYERIL